jgi:hypothetical protein
LYSHQLSANIKNSKATKALYDFTGDLNKPETIMPDSTIRTATLTSHGSNRSAKKAYKWLSGNPAVPVILDRLSKFPFLHAARLIPEKRFEEMGYVRQQSVCCMSFSIDLALILRKLCILALNETVEHLDHICQVLSLQPADFVASKMWKRAAPVPMAVMRKRDLSLFLVNCINSVHPTAWEATLVRRWGTSPFTGKAQWADRHDCVSGPLSVLDYG